MVNVGEICKTARAGSYQLQKLSSDARNAMITAIANAIDESKTEILQANAVDLFNFKGRDESFRDRLTLNDKRIDNMCEGLRQLIDLDDPMDEVVDKWQTKSGLEIAKVRAPLGVIGVIYEARPNVTADVIGLCIKTANAVVLRGGKDAINSNRAIFDAIKAALVKFEGAANAVQFIDDIDRSSTHELLKQGKYIDVIIPRGGDKLKEIVLAEATMPVIASAGGNCHTYIHESADLDKAVNVVINAKVQRPSVCNATEQLIIDKVIADRAVPLICTALSDCGVVIKGDKAVCALFDRAIITADTDYYEEHHSLVISVKIVDNITAAIAWINEHNTMHSDSILAEDTQAQQKFAKEVDSGCVYINASTRFTDGFEFGFGAEIAISTQKLHARGPLGLRQLTSEKYVITGDYTSRK